MTDVHFNGPLPDELDSKCLICVMMFKAAELELHSEWQAFANDGRIGGQAKWYPWDPGHPRLPLMRDGVIHAVSDVMPQIGLVWLCWDHVGAITVTRPSGLIDGSKLPPGFIKGKG